MNRRLKLFYSSSQRNEEVNQVCEYVTGKLIKSMKINILPRDNAYASDINYDILEDIDKTDIFVADVTPDEFSSGKPIYNSNVMIEIGYALSIHDENNILLFYDKEKFNDVEFSKMDALPLFLKNRKWNEYSFQNKDNIIEIITEKIKRMNKDNIMERIHHYYPQKFYDSIRTITNKSIQKFITWINKDNKQIHIIIAQSGEECQFYINVGARTLVDCKNNKERDLSSLTEINDELKHVEILTLLKYNMV